MNEPGACWPGPSRAKGPSAGCKDELHDEHPDLLSAWYALRDARAQRRAVQWLADNSLIDDEAANRLLTGPPGSRPAMSLRGYAENARLCRIGGVARPHTYSLTCMSLTRGGDRQLVVPFGSRAALIPILCL